MILRHGTSLLLLLLAACHATCRQLGAPIQPRDDRGPSATSGGDGGGSGGTVRALLQAAAQGAAGNSSAAAELGRTVVLYTQFGGIRVRLLEKLAPRITALVWDLAAKRGCSNAYKCAWYRNEAPPVSGLGPPYALLQGRMHDLAEDPPYEGIVPVKRGHVCFIPGGKDFFIALGDHPEWGTSHPVWGWVDDFFVADLIIAQDYSTWTHPEHGTVLRILKIEVPWRIATEGDRMFPGMLGPLH